MPFFRSSSAPLPFDVDFPAQWLVHGPSSVVAGSVTLDPAACRKDDIDSIEVSVICKQTSVFYRYYGGNSHDYRKEVRTLYADSLTLWVDAEGDPVGGRALVAPIDPPTFSLAAREYDEASTDTNGDGRLLNRVLSRVTSKGKGKEPARSSTSAGSMTLPFAKQLPAGPNDLPPSFEAGTLAGKPSGSDVGFIRWAVKVVGRRKGFLKSDRKTLLIFAYLPSFSTPPTAVPPKLPLQMDGSPPPQPRREDGWRTFGVIRPQREGIFKKKGLLVAQLAIPDLPSYPSPLEIPFHLTVLHLSPPLDRSASSSSGSPSGPKSSFRPEDLKLQLIRYVWTKAHGGEQTVEQPIVSDAIVSSSRRVWVGEQRVFDQTAWAGLGTSAQNRRRNEDAREAVGGAGRSEKKSRDESDDEEDEADLRATGVQRAGHEMVVTGALKLPVGPTFQAGTNPKGHLACSYILRLAVPLSRTFSSTTPLTLIEADSGLPLSTTLADGQGVPPTEALELDPDLATQTGGTRADELAGLPGYFDVVGKLGGDWGDDEKEN